MRPDHIGLNVNWGLEDLAMVYLKEILRDIFPLMEDKQWFWCNYNCKSTGYIKLFRMLLCVYIQTHTNGI